MDGSLIELLLAGVPALFMDMFHLANLDAATVTDLVTDSASSAIEPPDTEQTMSSSRTLGYILATGAVLIAYSVGGLIKSSPNILVITKGVHARASLSKLQLFFFTLLVLWIVIATLTWSHTLVDLSGDIVMLLGIGIAGTAGGKLTAVVKNRLDYDNWSWLIQKGWITESIERESVDRKPEFRDLLQSDGEFDISKFQLLVFSFVVGVALLYFVCHGNSVADFEIPDAYLALLGLSQAAYIGGKAVGPRTVGDLNKVLIDTRRLERDFVKAVQLEWSSSAEAIQPSLEAAIRVKPEAYREYRLRAEEAATMVGERVGKTIEKTNIEPSIPRKTN